MQSIILISLLLLTITIFSLQSVNGAPSKLKRAVTHSTPSHRSTTPTTHAAHAHETTTAGKALPRRTTTRSAAKVTTTHRKKTTTKPRAKRSRQKRLSEWNWA
ncbi:unnamed protein product [Rotaria sordida]|uniref:Uncharacterized protein n=1 Tax=Rotaria sordida TaxID=392033 RepID=A0A813T0P8_9BILA|nr:unnamed protein product [Rotaria sordida]CAF0905614.1 unnamed protein product [Rotaria sordida]CAF0909987.1 unnamed protein product [Rotaria sordida]CAF0915863.1 unnamed protein product [Rotaria sordida]CAF1017071.1 unnamed protein product [Rotaria sordida]